MSPTQKIFLTLAVVFGLAALWASQSIALGATSTDEDSCTGCEAKAALPVHTASLVDGGEETPRGFDIVDPSKAPASVRSTLESMRKQFQFVPNLARVMAASPALINGYWALQQQLREHGQLSQAELNVVQMTIAVENRCRYCTAGHTMAGRMFFKTPEEVLAALRKNGPLPDAKLSALQRFAKAVYQSRGRVTDESMAAFFKAGYTRGQALDVVACVAAKVMTNYTNQLAGTPLDEHLQPLAEGLPY